MTNVQAIVANGVLMQIEDEEESCSRAGARQEVADRYHDYQLPSGATFVDVGANIGIVSIYVATRNPLANVISLEPFPPNYKVLHRNVMRSRLTNIMPLPFAMSGEATTDFKMLYHPTCTGGASHWSSKEVAGGHVQLSAVAITLDNLFDRFVPPGPVVMKIDTEGEEHTIVPAFSYWDRVIHLHLEIHTNDNTRKFSSPERLLKIVDERLPTAATRKFHILEMGT